MSKKEFNYNEALEAFMKAVLDDPASEEHMFLDEEFEELFHDLYLVTRHSISDGHDGFSSQSKRSFGRKPKLEYWVNIPTRKVRKRLSWATRMTLKHEYGHIIMEYLHRERNMLLWDIFASMNKATGFRRLQRLYYWNPVVRFFKRLVGFSGKIDYKVDDPWEVDALRTGITRGGNEFFCDYFAWHYNSFSEMLQDLHPKGLTDEGQ